MTNISCLSPENVFVFTCPIFDVDTKISKCMKLRHKVWRGERIETMRGCQACMTSSKCPAALIVSKLGMAKDFKQLERYAADAPEKGRLHADILEGVLPVLVQAEAYRRFDVPALERNMIESAHARIQAQLDTAPTESGARRVKLKAQAPATGSTFVARDAGGSSVSKTETKSATQIAAETGDLAAAIK